MEDLLYESGVGGLKETDLKGGGGWRGEGGGMGGGGVPAPFTNL